MNQSKIKVSVIMAVHNQNLFLEKSIKSILNQSYRKFYFLIIDDGSDKKTKKILEKYKNKDNRIKILTNKKNIGLPKSLNKAIKLVKTELIARMDADDISLKNRLKKQVNFFRKKKYLSILGSNAIIINHDGKTIKKSRMETEHKRIVKDIYYKNPIIHPSVMFKKFYFYDIGGYDNSYRKCQDYDLWIRSKNKYIFANLKENLIKYRSSNQYTFTTLKFTLKTILKNSLKYNEPLKGIVGILKNLIVYIFKNLRIVR